MPHDNEPLDAPAGTPAPEPASDAIPAGGPEGPSSAVRETVSRSELDKVIRERQAAKQRARAAEAALASLRRQLGDSQSTTPAEKIPDDAETPQAASTPDTSSSDRMADKRPWHPSQDPAADGMADERPVRAEGTPTVDDSTALTERLAARERQLAELLRDQRLRSAAQASGAVNAEQVVALLRDRLQMFEREGGQYAAVCVDPAGRPAVDETGAPVEPEQLVREFLAQPENANLVRAGSTGGSGARLAGAAGGADILPRSLEDFNALPPARRRQIALRLSRRQREALLGLGPGEGAAYL